MKEEDKSQKREPEDVLFRYRSYGKSELASLYLPDILPGSAMREFNEWIADGGFVCHRTGTEVKTLHSGTSQADSGGAGGTVRKWEISSLPFLYVSQHFHPRLAQM